MAVRIGPLPDSTLVAVPVHTDRRCSPRLDGRRIRRMPTGLPCTHFTGLSAPGGWRFRENQRRFAVGRGGTLSCNHFNVDDP